MEFLSALLKSEAATSGLDAHGEKDAVNIEALKAWHMLRSVDVKQHTATTWGFHPG